MKCLVAGSLGFCGTWICRELAKQGVEVIAFDLNSTPPEDRIWDDVVGEGVVRRATPLKQRIWKDDVSHLIKIEQGDARQLPDVLAVFKKHKIESVINTIALIPGTGANVQNMFLANVVAVFNLLEAARIFEIKRFIQMSTTGVYPGRSYYEGKWKGSYQPLTEEHPVTSGATHASDYHGTKAFAEALGVRYHDVYGLNFISLRSSSTFGPGRRVWKQHPGNYTKVVMDAAQGQETHVDKGGDTDFSPQYIRDLAEAVVVVHQHPKPSFLIYNVSGPVITFSHWLDVINELTGLHCSAGPGPFSGWVPEQGSFSIERISKDLGWRPRYKLKDAVAEYINYLRGGELK